ncbi:hypothetical protein M3J09_007224 [Ascochyta lentis]
MMNLRLIARRVPATRAFSTSRVCYSGKSSMTEVSDGGSKHDKVQEPQSSIKPEGEPNPKQNVDHVEAAKAKNTQETAAHPESSTKTGNQSQ